MSVQRLSQRRLSRRYIVGPKPDPYLAYDTLRLHFDGANGATSVSDEQGRAWALADGATLTTSDKKFGTAALNVNFGSANIPVTPAFDLGVGAYTFEGWVKILSGTRASLMTRAQSTTGIVREYSFFIENLNSLSLYYGVRGSNMTVRQHSIPSVALNQWHHFAFTRDNAGVMRAFLNGVASANTYTDAVDLSNPSAPICVGTFWQGETGNATDGRYDDFRLTKACRYTSNFAVPTGPF